MKRLTMIILCLALLSAASAQSKKERKKFKIRSTTEWEMITRVGKTTRYKLSYEEFDKAGRSILKEEFAPCGTLLHRETASYDRFDNKTEEVQYNAAGGVEKKTLFTYDANGNKTIETVTDASGKVIKQVMFMYNAKNLKTGKETIRGADQQDRIKKWEYEYY